MAIQERNLRPDSKGRLTIGEKAKRVSSYDVLELDNGNIILKPKVEIPACESWLYQNKESLDSVKRGLKEASLGKGKSLGSFSQYAEEED